MEKMEMEMVALGVFVVVVAAAGDVVVVVVCHL